MSRELKAKLFAPSFELKNAVGAFHRMITRAGALDDGDEVGLQAMLDIADVKMTAIRSEIDAFEKARRATEAAKQK